MIKLEVEGYCQACLDFNPIVIKPTCVELNNGDKIYSDTIVQCEHRRRCAGIVRFLAKQKMKEEA